MNGIERIKLIGKLVQLNKTVPGASPVERIKGIGQIITIVKQLGGMVNAGGANAGALAIHSDDELVKAWTDYVNGKYETPAEKLAANQRVVDAGEKYLIANYPTMLMIEGASREIYQYEDGDWQWWGADGENPDDYYGDSRLSGEVVEKYARIRAGWDSGKILKLAHIGAEGPARADFSDSLSKNKVTSVEDFCRRIEKNPVAIQDSENQTRKLLFAYLEEKYPSGFKGTLSLEGADNKNHAYAAVWSRTNGEWYRDVQVHPEMTGALSQLDQNGSLVLFDFLRFASNGSLNSLPKYTPDVGEVSEAMSEAWTKDRETLQSIMDGTHPDMKLPVLYDALAGINERQKDNPEYPEMLEKALDKWQSVVMDMTAKIVA